MKLNQSKVVMISKYQTNIKKMVLMDMILSYMSVNFIRSKTQWLHQRHAYLILKKELLLPP